MNTQVEQKQRLLREWWLTSIAVLVVLSTLVFADLARPLGNVLYDHLMRWQGFQANQDIVIVAVDDRSLAELGGWPLQRAHYTHLLERLDDERFRPKAIGLDLLFLDRSDQDAALAEQMRRHRTVLPLAFELHNDAQHQLRPTPPVAPLDQAATLGHINALFDEDGVIRGVQAREQQWPHFALALQGQDGTNAVPYQRFRMVDPRVGFPLVSLSDALTSNAFLSLFKDKYVLIGVTAPSLGDRYPTLYSGQHNASTPGVAILASILNASLRQDMVDVAPSSVVFGVSCIAVIGMLLSVLILSPRHALAFGVTLMAASVVASYAVLIQKNYWFDPTAFLGVSLILQPLWAWGRLDTIVNFVQEKATLLRAFRHTHRVQHDLVNSHEVVLQQAKLLDHAIDSVRSELNFLSAIIDEMPDAVVIFDQHDALLLSNQRIKQLLKDTQLIPGSQRSLFFETLQLPPPLADSTASPPFQLATSLGLRDFYLKSTSVYVSHGESFHLLILLDITELRQSQNQRDRALQFLSHDMRTPLAAIMSLTRPPKDGDEAPQARLQRQKIVQHSQTLLQMMDDFILTISAQQAHYSLKTVLVDELLNDAIEQVRDLARGKQLSFVNDSEALPLFVKVNTRLMVRALVNLLVNAVKFSPPQSCITLQISQPSAHEVNISLKNTVAPQTDEHLLAGFGLGLDFIDTVIDKHQGEIKRHIPLQGLATIIITLPCEAADLHE
ncbi:CHASE2 domain-containing protein [Limnohabitans sp. B9-3]|uniref:CHASE2 domain-containing protein n=1 Tax=Limnohabitans sp. B9-3 TaxID=1100707 RepID=UPI0013045D16|nr:CHASE2 domain-containing protein [Limnohabitans sp. B9-3]